MKLSRTSRVTRTMFLLLIPGEFVTLKLELDTLPQPAVVYVDLTRLVVEHNVSLEVFPAQARGYACLPSTQVCHQERQWSIYPSSFAGKTLALPREQTSQRRVGSLKCVTCYSSRPHRSIHCLIIVCSATSSCSSRLQ